MFLAGRLADAFKMAYSNANHPRRTSGINKSSLFRHLDLFDMILDFMADYMHMSKGVIKDHLIELMKGERSFNKPVALEVDSEATEGTRNPVQVAPEQKEELDAIKEVLLATVFHAI
jgi:hypothetical protein